MNVACPQCGNPQLDVDSANSVVYCKQCGFAVRVDPTTGQVTPISPQAGAPTGGGQVPQGPPEAYGSPTILGMDPLTFFLGSSAAVLLASIMFNLDNAIPLVAILIIFIIYWYNR